MQRLTPSIKPRDHAFDDVVLHLRLQPGAVGRCWRRQRQFHHPFGFQFGVPPPPVFQHGCVKPSRGRHRGVAWTCCFSIASTWCSRPPKRVPVLRGPNHDTRRCHLRASALQLLKPEPDPLFPSTVHIRCPCGTARHSTPSACQHHNEIRGAASRGCNGVLYRSVLVVARAPTGG